MLVTAGFGLCFVGMQAFEWTKLIVEEGVRPWGNPMGAAQFGADILYGYRVSWFPRIYRGNLLNYCSA